MRDTEREDAVHDLVERASGAAAICLALAEGNADMDDAVRDALRLVYWSLVEAAGRVERR